MVGRIRICLGVSDDPMFLWISSNSCPLNLLLVRSHQAEIIIVKHLIQGSNYVTRVRVEPRSCDRGGRKNDAFTLSASTRPNFQRLMKEASFPATSVPSSYSCTIVNRGRHYMLYVIYRMFVTRKIAKNGSTCSKNNDYR